MKYFCIPSPTQQLNSEFLSSKGVEVFVKRDDLIHPEISGNKWRKLKYNVEAAKNKGLDTLLTFGGAYSNHIAATAAVGNLLDLNTIGVIRGEEGFENKTINTAAKNGMHLLFISRANYREKSEESYINNLKSIFGEFYLIPEGGANELSVKGCEEILIEVEDKYDFICCSAGTGTTVSGICNRLEKEKLLVFPALKGGSFILDEMKKYCSPQNLEKVEFQLEYHFGGYGKTKPEQIQFMNQFSKDYGFELDKVYTSKMFFGLFDLIEKGKFKEGTKILAIHTGGLQGN